MNFRFYNSIYVRNFAFAIEMTPTANVCFAVRAVMQRQGRRDSRKKAEKEDFFL